MKSEPPPVLFIGCGRMGGALAKALVSDRRVFAFDPQADLPDGVERIHSLNDKDLPDELTVILAVKPQGFTGMTASLSALVGERRLFLSIMAGITLQHLAQVFGANAPIIRAMPNTPASIGFGISAAAASDNCTLKARADVSRILGAAGEVIWLDQESDLDAVTAVSGSGPAFFYRFAEAMIAAGVAEGLSEPVASQLVRQTFIGAARLCEMDPVPLATLREQVTSPGGTTAAGLAVMDSAARADEMARAIVQAAARRSRELSANS